MLIFTERVFNHKDAISIKYVLQYLFCLFSKFGLKMRQTLWDNLILNHAYTFSNYELFHEVKIEITAIVFSLQKFFHERVFLFSTFYKITFATRNGYNGVYLINKTYSQIANTRFVRDK